MTLHLTCAFEVIKLTNERVIALYHHFFLQFLHLIEIGQKVHNSTTSRPPVQIYKSLPENSLGFRKGLRTEDGRLGINNR